MVNLCFSDSKPEIVSPTRLYIGLESWREPGNEASIVVRLQSLSFMFYH